MLMTVGQNIDRLRSDGAFAALCGASPIRSRRASAAAKERPGELHIRSRPRRVTIVI
jgi:hypothetical protein